MASFSPRLVIIVGSPGSGKDLVIQAVNDLGSQHAMIVPKHTSRPRREDDRNEMICCDDDDFDLDKCDVVYDNFGTLYGIDSSLVWRGLRKGVFQVCVVSNKDAINHLKRIFGRLVLLLYVYSEITAEEFEESSETKDDYVRRRVKDFRMADSLYLDNFLSFDHVLIYSGAPEDLFDQIFRLFRAYEIGLAGR